MLERYLTPFERFILSVIEDSAVLRTPLTIPDTPKAKAALAVLEARGLITICATSPRLQIFSETFKALTWRTRPAA